PPATSHRRLGRTHTPAPAVTRPALPSGPADSAAPSFRTHAFRADEICSGPYDYQGGNDVVIMAPHVREGVTYALRGDVLDQAGRPVGGPARGATRGGVGRRTDRRARARLRRRG